MHEARQVTDDTSTAEALSSFLTALSLEALDDEILDELGRKPLVDQLADLVLKKPEGKFTLGVEGGWGSGKTTVLNFLATRLEGEGFEIVRLSAWEYREPARLMRGYLERLEEALARTHDTFGLPKLFRRFASGLVSVSPGRLSGFLDKALGDLDHEGDEALRIRIEQVLKRRGKPLVVFVDDLDRIDADELQAILRAIRYLNQLPKLIHVLAYDRAQLSKTLFPDDPAGTRARDYLGKLVQLEISVGSAPLEKMWASLRTGLMTLARLRPSSAISQSVLDLIDGGPFELVPILRGLSTPRELKRLILRSALYARGPRLEVNMKDLLIVLVLQLRYPLVYSAIAANQSLLTHPLWAWKRDRGAMQAIGPVPNSVELIERTQRLRKEILERLEVQDRGLVEELMAVLFDGLPQVDEDHGQERRISWRGELEAQAFLRRRLIHPACFGSYFWSFLPEGQVAASEYGEFLAIAQEPGESNDRILKVTSTLQRWAEDRKLESFAERWNLWPPEWSDVGERDPFSGTRDLLLGVARSWPLLAEVPSREIRNIDVARDWAIEWTRNLLRVLWACPDPAVGEGVLEGVVQEIRDPALLFWFKDPEVGEKAKVGLEQFTRGIEELVRSKGATPPSGILALPLATVWAIMQGFSEFPEQLQVALRDQVRQELQQSPERLPHFLAPCARIRYSPPPPRPTALSLELLDPWFSAEERASWPRDPELFRDDFDRQLVRLLDLPGMTDEALP